MDNERRGQVLDRLREIQGELCSRTHLALADATAGWERSHLQRAGWELQGVIDEARVQGYLGVGEARDAWQTLEEAAIVFAETPSLASIRTAKRALQALAAIIGTF